MGKTLCAICAGLVLLAAGCTGRTYGSRLDEVRVLHQHDETCGHYFHDGRWYYVMNHVHEVGCGHYFYNGVWNLNPPTPGFTTHVMTCQERDKESPSQAPREWDYGSRDRGYHTYWK